jgi:hypothetical protein
MSAKLSASSEFCAAAGGGICNECQELKRTLALMDKPKQERVEQIMRLRGAFAEFIAGVEKDVNENGGSGWLLARLSDARAAFNQ